MMKRFLLTAGVTAISLAPLAVLAQQPPQDIVFPIVQNVLNVARLLVTLVFVLSIVVFGWGIVKFVLAAGDPKKLTEAKGYITWGVIGMAVGASLFGLITFLRTYFGVSGGQLIITPPTVL